MDEAKKADEPQPEKEEAQPEKVGEINVKISAKGSPVKVQTQTAVVKPAGGDVDMVENVSPANAEVEIKPQEDQNMVIEAKDDMLPAESKNNQE